MDVNSLVATVFSGLSGVVVEGVTDGGDTVVVTARTRGVAVPCPVCGMPTMKVHGYHGRTVADVPVDGRQVVVRLRVRRLVCPVLGCARQTFREQVPGLLERHQRRTVRLAGHIAEVARGLCGRAGARLANLLAMPVSRSAVLRWLWRLPVPEAPVPRVIGVDDFALRRRHRYATIITDAVTGRRIEVLPGRDADPLEAWLRRHPGVEVVCRDGSATYAEAIRRALPNAVQVSDRWHLWRNLCDKVQLEVRAHAGCWAAVLNPPLPGGIREQTTRERWNKVHTLLGPGRRPAGLLPPPRPRAEHRQALRPHARAHRSAHRTGLPAHSCRPLPRTPAPSPDRGAWRPRPPPLPRDQGTRLHRQPQRPAQIPQPGPRRRRPRPVTTPRRAARLLLTDPENLRPKEATLLEKITAACPEMTELADLVRGFAALLTPAQGNDLKLTEWITATRAAALPHLHSFTNGLELDRSAADAGLTLPYHNGRTEGVNTRTKRIMRQMHGRAGFDLLRHRILLH